MLLSNIWQSYLPESILGPVTPIKSVACRTDTVFSAAIIHQHLIVSIDPFKNIFREKWWLCKKPDAVLYWPLSDPSSFASSSDSLQYWMSPPRYSLSRSSINICIFFFGFSFPLASNLLRPMVLLQEGEKENGRKKKSGNKTGRRVYSDIFVGRRLQGRK